MTYDFIIFIIKIILFLGRSFIILDILFSLLYRLPAKGVILSPDHHYHITSSWNLIYLEKAQFCMNLFMEASSIFHYCQVASIQNIIHFEEAQFYMNLFIEASDVFYHHWVISRKILSDTTCRWNLAVCSCIDWSLLYISSVTSFIFIRDTL